MGEILCHIGHCTTYHPKEGRSVVVTGTAGIGHETALAFAQADTEVRVAGSYGNRVKSLLALDLVSFKYLNMEMERSPHERRSLLHTFFAKLRQKY